jgi:hypothetical protein
MRIFYLLPVVLGDSRHWRREQNDEGLLRGRWRRCAKASHWKKKGKEISVPKMQAIKEFKRRWPKEDFPFTMWTTAPARIHTTTKVKTTTATRKLLNRRLYMSGLLA